MILVQNRHLQLNGNERAILRGKAPSVNALKFANKSSCQRAFVSEKSQ